MTAEARAVPKAPLRAALAAALLLAAAAGQAKVRLEVRAVTPVSGVARAGDPLLVAVLLSNPAAQSRLAGQREREDARAALEALPAFAALPAEARRRAAEDLAAQPEPALELGSDARAAASLVRVELRRGGAAQAGSPRPLAANAELPASVRLDAETSLLLVFGLDAETTAALPLGRYALHATLSGELEAISAEAGFELEGSAARAGSDREERAIRYYLLDRDHTRAGQLARRWLQNDPDAWLAAELLGDALAGQGDREGGVEAYRRALASYAAGAEAARARYLAQQPAGAPSPEWEEPVALREKLTALRLEEPPR